MRISERLTVGECEGQLDAQEAAGLPSALYAVCQSAHSPRPEFCIVTQPAVNMECRGGVVSRYSVPELGLGREWEKK